VTGEVRTPPSSICSAGKHPARRLLRLGGFPAEVDLHHSLDDGSWDYYERWLTALMQIMHNV
jgi:hypothetical protein